MNNNFKNQYLLVLDLLRLEHLRQLNTLNLIASENFVSKPILQAIGSSVVNKYAEGYPSKRYYAGCENIDAVEKEAIGRAKDLFQAEHVNVQPHSGTNANLAVYLAAIRPGDKVLAMKLNHGGHLSHGSKMGMAGMIYKFVFYGVNDETGYIDYSELEKIAIQEKPQIILVGASAYPRVIDFERIAFICKKVNAKFWVDMAHIAGLVASGMHISPIPYADFITSTTHKTLRGPRGGLILCKKEYGQKVDSSVFPGVQGGPLMNMIAGKAICFGEAMCKEFRDYQKKVLENAQALACQFALERFEMQTNGTDTHLILLNIGRYRHDASKAEEELSKIRIVVNRNLMPNQKRMGIRLGSAAISTQGFGVIESAFISHLIGQALMHKRDISLYSRVLKLIDRRLLSVEFDELSSFLI
ncbi:MAG: serine hydroxymethyltransferase [Deltaproteobacteria bacterium]|nr:MAG: serine hydroxymethyltransferase [Deltaproteobacteria bacterium]